MYFGCCSREAWPDDCSGNFKATKYSTRIAIIANCSINANCLYTVSRTARAATATAMEQPLYSFY